MNHRRMKDPAFHGLQVDRLARPEHRQIRNLVNDLRTCGCGFVPHVAPTFGGNEAKILLLLSDPGPRAGQRGLGEGAGGSGYLSHENDDPSAERLGRLLGQAGLLGDDGRYSLAKAPEVIGWNAYPWMVDRTPSGKIRAPRVAERKAGHAPLLRLLSKLPELKVIIPMGRVAEDTCRRFRQTTSGMAIIDMIECQGIKLLTPTCHPSNQGILSVAHGERQILARLKTAARLIQPN